MTHIAEALARFPRAHLTRLPTPLDRFSHLGDELGIDLRVKREDLADLALGGDKPRKLSFELPHALEAGVTTLVTTGSAQSNHARLTTAAALKLGLDAVIIASNDRWRAMQGNHLLVHLMGARVVIADTDEHWDLEEAALAECARIDAEGGKAHYIPVSGTTPLGSLAGVEMAVEIVDQLGDDADGLAAVYVPFGTGGGYAGVLFGLRELGVDCPVVGISVNKGYEACVANLDGHWQKIAGLLEINPTRDMGNWEIDAGHIGPGYGEPTETCLDAIALVAQTEGVLLDPVYSGKLFGGMIDHVRSGRWDDQMVVAIHTGGVPALFAYSRVIEDHLGLSPEHPAT